MSLHHQQSHAANVEAARQWLEGVRLSSEDAPRGGGEGGGRGARVKAEGGGSGMEGVEGEGAEREEKDALADKWKLLPAFIKARGLVRQHIESYDHFIEVELNEIMRANEKITTEADHAWYFKYTSIKVGKPSLEESMVISNSTPQECRLRELTYAAPIIVSVEYTRGRELVHRDNVIIGHMPVMLRSGRCVLRNRDPDELARFRECPYDPGGYFVVKGVEKVILIQEQLSKNRIIVEFDKKGQVCASVTSSTHERKSKSSIVSKGGKFYLQNNILTDHIPVAIVFKALGVETDQEIVQLVGSKFAGHLAASLDECSQAHKVATSNQALEWLGRRIKAPRRYVVRRSNQDNARDALAHKILSHVPVVDFNFAHKATYVALMIRRIIAAIEDPSQMDDKDYYGNKRLELAGQLLALLFEDLFKRFNFELAETAKKVLSKTNKAAQFDILKDLRQDSITNGLVNAISTGNWTVKRFRMERLGVTQVLSRLSFMSALGMMTRVQSQFEKTRKVSGPRALQPSSWGMICPADTPEGESCGLVKNLALLTHVTTDYDERPVSELAYNLGVADVGLLCGDELHSTGAHLVLLNGRLLGIHRNPARFAARFRQMRRQGYVSPYVSVHVSDAHGSVHISCDGGRVCRPLLIVEGGRPLVRRRHLDQLQAGTRTFSDFVKDGLVEYLDVNEENNGMLALREAEMGPETTHLEIDPMSILGVVAGLVVWPHHNQAPRNTYQCAMGKQAMGSISYNQLNRIDTLLYLLVYPQKPLVKTRTIEMVGFEQLPAGQNASIAVMSYSGYDIEDAVVMNRGSLDRGFGRCIVLRKNVATVKRYPNGAVDRIVPQGGGAGPGAGLSAARTSTLDRDGLARVGELVPSGHMLVSKESPTNTSDPVNGGTGSNASEYRPSPLAYKGPVPARVDQVLVSSNEADHLIVKVLMRDTRRPELGDKFSSRHGQKGVCGLIVAQEDMPFNEQGVCPDLIMNPHGFPSRMTVGKIRELVAGKAALMDGKLKYGTAFGGTPLDEITRVLVSNKWSYSGKDLLTSGITGETIGAYIFAGPVYYQKLKHMVMDKMHARPRGPRAALTRQPTEGRSRDGGLRLGEMERDVLLGYGASGLLIERLLVSSDAHAMEVCGECGVPGYENFCPLCHKRRKLEVVIVPYAFRLLCTELMSMNIMPRLGIERF